MSGHQLMDGTKDSNIHPKKLPIILLTIFLFHSKKNKKSLICTSCSINKAHQQSFRSNSLTSDAPLDHIYTDVWGSVPSIGIDGSCYYLILVDYFTKYIWIYPLPYKSGVSTVFPQFKHLFETRFQLRIKSVYSDNGR